MVKWGKSALIALTLIAGLAGFSASAVATTKHPTYALGTAKRCRTGYVKITAKKTEKVRVKLHGKWVEKTETVRYAACEYLAVAAIGAVSAPTTTTTTTTEPAPTYPAPVITVPTSTTTTIVTTTPTTTSSLPFTGADVGLLLAGGLILCAGGFVVRRVSRRFE